MGNPVEFTIKELAETVLKMVGGSSKLVFNPLPQDDPKQRQPNITLARNNLGWEPSIKLEQGLEKTVAYFRTLLGS
jgi:UDP-glucuronate decarboxylase